jgi:hypothetical protein
MSDKSPRQHLTKKSGKSIKEKRAAKRAGKDAKAEGPLGGAVKRDGNG